ncbi:hypothetical protein PF005_g27884 [Phytophthora fragariae]|uniref:Uncharacterized protein n=1 Tax=Phytophthora fragariae TaxID=53985 RepID=A0A6A3VPF4_9STRA|nr:hypothetical protein PF003_g30208 [Phytophthora fragariae]KAE8920844.1 hypothetical protein PF009_g28868 [Phytophthora fragariae]KAE8978715.1 hypothetical protein PF011_g23127 [Phytophthora fragariae]KAE9054040.1 hypothetical protein PF010_g32697 [Phytophthora fragariae]KAE9067947.1 hypothetical protein PF007_g27874 [Phytophthora fragariae]
MMGGMRLVCLGCSAASNGSFTSVYFSGPPYYYHFIYETTSNESMLPNLSTNRGLSTPLKRGTSLLSSDVFRSRRR